MKRERVYCSCARIVVEQLEKMAEKQALQNVGDGTTIASQATSRSISGFRGSYEYAISNSRELSIISQKL